MVTADWNRPKADDAFSLGSCYVIRSDQACFALIFFIYDSHKFENKSIYGIWFDTYLNLKLILALPSMGRTRFKCHTADTVSYRVNNGNCDAKICIAFPLSSVELDSLACHERKRSELASPFFQRFISRVYLGFTNETPTRCMTFDSQQSVVFPKCLNGKLRFHQFSIKNTIVRFWAGCRPLRTAAYDPKQASPRVMRWAINLCAGSEFWQHGRNSQVSAPQLV